MRLIKLAGANGKDVYVNGEAITTLEEVVDEHRAWLNTKYLEGVYPLDLSTCVTVLTVGMMHVYLMTPMEDVLNLLAVTPNKSGPR